MELKTKYQYTYFIYPYTIDEKKYDKYILKLLKNKKCKFRIFEKEKDLDIYNHFLPNVREYLFPTFEYRDKILRDFKLLSKEKKSKIISNENIQTLKERKAVYIINNKESRQKEENYPNVPQLTNG